MAGGESRYKTMAKSSDILTTGEVAKICKVAPRTVSKWFDSGQLRGYRIPGSKDRRIPKNELLIFMDKHGIPHNGLAPGKLHALIVATNGAPKNPNLQNALAQNSFEVHSVESVFTAGILAERHKPQVIFWEIEADSQNNAQIPWTIRVLADLAKTKVVALTNSNQQRELEDYGFDACLSLDLDEARMTGLIAELAATIKLPPAANPGTIVQMSTAPDPFRARYCF